MRRPDHYRALARWLAAEQAGRAEEAEAALEELCAALPRPAPPARFAAGVMARLGWSRMAAAAGAAGHGIFAALWFRVATALCGAAAIGLLAGLPVVWRAFASVLSPARSIQLAVSSLITLHQWLVTVLEVGAKLVLLGRMLAGSLATVPVAALATVSLLVSALAFRILRDLIARDRRWVYADPI